MLPFGVCRPGVFHLAVKGLTTARGSAAFMSLMSEFLARASVSTSPDSA